MSSHPDIAPDKWSHILSELRAIEARDNVRIIFAVESGSRAWGFPSPDSDYDVRFVYAHPQDWYLSLTPSRDVIEIPLEGDDDISGWDIKKALGLALKPNPVLLEWLSSSIKYIWNAEACSALQMFSRHIAHGTACRHHYMRMATLQSGDGDVIKLKRYVYALRAAMALRWIDTHHEAPPMNFQTLMAGVEIPKALKVEIDSLLIKKRDAVELGTGSRIASIEAFLNAEISRAMDTPNADTSAGAQAQNRVRGDELFRSLISQTTAS